MTIIINTIAPAVLAAGLLPRSREYENERPAVQAQDNPRTVRTIASAPALRSTEIS
jgi:hypothetical protein